MGFSKTAVAFAIVWTCATAAMPGPSFAQTFPNRPIRLINGFAAGGNADAVARLVAQKMSERLGQPIVIESKPGAGTSIANAYVAKADPDGYTLLLVSGAFPTTSAMTKELTYDPVGDFAWVSSFISYPLAVVVPPDSPYKTVSDVIAAAKAKPKQLNYPSPGVGSLVHLAAELFNTKAGIEITHIPFRGGAEPLVQIMSGRMDIGFETLTFVTPQLRAGKVKVLAVTSLKRMPTMADVPAVAETLPGYEAISFLGIAAPKDTPAAIVARLNEEVKLAVDDPDIQRRFLELGGTPWTNTPSEMRDFVAGEVTKWKSVLQQRNIAPQ